MNFYKKLVSEKINGYWYPKGSKFLFYITLIFTTIFLIGYICKTYWLLGFATIPLTIFLILTGYSLLDRFKD